MTTGQFTAGSDPDTPGPAAGGPGVGGSGGWNRGVLRNINERVLLDRVWTGGPVSRAQLARDTGLSKPTVSTALDNLERAGLVRPVGLDTPARGRSAVLYEPDPGAGHVVGIDVGRSWIRVAVADLAGRVVAREDRPNKARSAGIMLHAAATQAHDILASVGLGPSAVVHSVMGCPGVYDPRSDRIEYAVNLPGGWGRPGLRARMQEALESTVDVVNDANLAALGEYHSGAGAGSPLFVYVTVGTGLGMGVVADGRVFQGAHGAAGEIGYLPLSPRATDDPAARPAAPTAATAPRRGMLEDAVSADAVVRAAVARGMPGNPTAKDVFDAARLGPGPAADAVQQEAARLAHVVAAVSAVIDPELVVLGGGIGANADLLLEPMTAELHTLTPLRPHVTVSSLGGDAVLLGAVATAVETAREQVFARYTAWAQEQG
ncbi:ROK family transcriptional regulator [Yinghuangia seranimata]|uniref:ROK family transcriptional regulator n=1 Tax=Yinghuangia seranimata TaxID=408067 RepID=UPI00248B29BD|nr:ROK family transcriptional regulator [Yinghuangia seranimata]MDI2129669.1 ROK family transcriptional regulator [Yinghuangia seranimata]